MKTKVDPWRNIALTRAYTVRDWAIDHDGGFMPLGYSIRGLAPRIPRSRHATLDCLVGLGLLAGVIIGAFLVGYLVRGG